MTTFAFFGSSDFSIHVLDALEAQGLEPKVVITTPNKPKGRGLALAPTAVKVWAQKKGIPVLDPAKLDLDFIEGLKKYACEVSVVASYGKMIPEAAIGLPTRGTLNVHPSFLPKYRGASPIQGAMLDDAKDTGVTIIELDKEMDHGPIVATENVRFDEWPSYEDVEKRLGDVGGRLLAKILPEWIKGTLQGAAQDHAQATFTKKITKEDGLLDTSDVRPDAPADRAYLAFRKIQAYHAWPGAYFFIEKIDPTTHEIKKTRVKINRASWHDGKLDIERVTPEGKREMLYKDFLRG